MDKEQIAMLKAAEAHCETSEPYVTSDYIAGWKAKTQYIIDEKERFNKVLEKVTKELCEMPAEEFKALIDKQEPFGLEPFIQKESYSGEDMVGMSQADQDIQDLQFKLKEAADLIIQAESRLRGMMMGNFINVRELDNSIKRVYQEDSFMPTLRKMQQFIAENK